jgi:uncharacterized membrane protein
MKRVKRFGIYQTSKVASIITFFVTLIFMVPFALMTSCIRNVTGEGMPGFPFGGGVFFIIMPFIYAIVGFIMTALSCWIYNLVAARTGGIELEFETFEDEE